MDDKARKTGSDIRAATFKLDPDVVAQTMGDQLILVNLRTNRIHTLNTTAIRLWELLAEGLTRDETEHRLLSEFDVEGEVLKAEVDAVLSELSEAELIVAGLDD